MKGATQIAPFLFFPPSTLSSIWTHFHILILLSSGANVAQIMLQGFVTQSL